MTLYLARWDINIEAETPQEAAERARHYQTLPDTTATVFEVFEPTHGSDPVNGAALVAKIDLTYPEENQFFSMGDLINTDETAEYLATLRTTDNQRAVTPPPHVDSIFVLSIQWRSGERTVEAFATRKAAKASARMADLNGHAWRIDECTIAPHKGEPT